MQEAETQSPRTTQQNITQVGLPELTGTPEEIAQAGPIRTQLLMQADDLMSQLRSQERCAPLLPDDSPPPAIAEAEAGLQKLRNQMDAAWWITHQNDSARQLLELTILLARNERR